MKRWFRGVSTGWVVMACLSAGGPSLRAQESPPAAPPQAAAAPSETPAYSLSLEDVLKSAMENNLDIAVRRIDPKVAETTITTAESAFDPQVFGSATVGVDHSPQADRLSGGFVSSSRDKTFA